MITATIVFEHGVEDPEHGRQYIVSGLTNAHNRMRDGAVAIIVKDESGHIIGHGGAGQPSTTFQEDIEKAFGINQNNQKQDRAAS